MQTIIQTLLDALALAIFQPRYRGMDRRPGADDRETHRHDRR
jgi:hypothetical protein